METDKLSPTGRIVSASPRLQNIEPPMSDEQKRDIAAIRAAFAESFGSPLNLDFSELEKRVLAHGL
jgi:DNA polymerase I-like protein with 3'-5' exonuclease and polymerase domains